MGHHHGVWPINVFILLTCSAKCSISLPINDQVPEDTRPWLNNLTEYDTARYAGRTLKAIDLNSCEFGDTREPYNESCPNGAIDILPCNPGQLKIAECIGQDGDTSRMCDPCPQKYYQSGYNRCTACHQCSECGPNKQIRQRCTDKTNTVCESITGTSLDPVPTTTPKPKSTPTSPASAQSSTYTPGTTTDVSLAETKSTSALTYMNADTTQLPVLSTTQAEKEEPIATSKGSYWKPLAISVIVLCLVLLAVLFLQRAKIIKQKRELKNITQNDMPCDGGHEERGGSVHPSGKSNGKNIPMKKRDSRLPSNLASSKVHADIHSAPEIVQDPSAAHHDSDTHRDAPSRPKPSPNYENLNGMNQTNMEAPSTSGGSGSIHVDSDGPCATGPEQDNGGAIADPPKTLHSTTPRPKQEGLHKANPLMQQQASPEVVTIKKKEQKRKGIIRSLIPRRKMSKKEYSAVPLEDSSLSSKAGQ